MYNQELPSETIKSLNRRLEYYRQYGNRFAVDIASAEASLEHYQAEQAKLDAAYAAATSTDAEAIRKRLVIRIEAYEVRAAYAKGKKRREFEQVVAQAKAELERL